MSAGFHLACILLLLLLSGSGDPPSSPAERPVAIMLATRQPLEKLESPASPPDSGQREVTPDSIRPLGTARWITSGVLVSSGIGTTSLLGWVGLPGKRETPTLRSASVWLVPLSATHDQPTRDGW